MSKISGPAASIAVVAIFLSGIGAGLTIDSAAGADSCVAAPSAAAPAGQHWYYHLDRANHRKCWYLHATVPPANQVQPPAAAAEPANVADPAPQPAAAADPGNADPALQSVAAAPPSAGDPAGVQPSESDANSAQPAPHVRVLVVRPVAAPFVDATAESQPQENTAAPLLPQTLPNEQNTASVKPAEVAATTAAQAAPDIANREPAQTIDAARAAARTRSGEMFLLLALALGIAAAFIAIIGKIAGPYRAPGFADHPDAAWMRYRTGRQQFVEEGAYDEGSYEEQEVPFLNPEPHHGLADVGEQNWIDQHAPAEPQFPTARSRDAHPAPAEPPSVKDIELALRILRQARQSRVASRT